MQSGKWKAPKLPFARFKRKVFENAKNVSGFIVQIGESEALRRPSKDIPLEKINSDEVKEKIKYLKNCLLKYRRLTGYGRGIAAVQVGIPERFAITYTPEKLITIINPKITKMSKGSLKYPEMCMSAGCIIAPVVRPSWVEFDYYDENGKLQSWNTKDDTDINRMMNRVFQHEIDHLDGIINIDLVKSPRELILESDPDFYKTTRFEEA